MNQGPLTPVIKGIAAGIGLASEYAHHRREQKAAKEAVTVTSVELKASDNSLSTVNKAHDLMRTQSSGDSKRVEPEVTEVDDQKQWALDEAQDELIGATEKPKDKHIERDPAKIAKRFTHAHPPAQDLRHGGIPLPVVLPQRRPQDRTRGFIRAYAPELHDCDIDQETFLEFLETFNQATLASPWLDAINLASLAFVTLPTVISQAASIAIALAVKVAKNMQSRHRYNNILDQLNDDFFRPRGLYALVLTWNPDSDNMKVGVNLNEAIAKNLVSPQGMEEKIKHSLRPSMQNTIGVAFSETAPLVFPALESLVNNQTPEAKEFKQKLRLTKSFIADYFDRRAQAQHVGDHPDSQLAVGPRPVFTSKYSDPNNPSNSGSLLALVTGGKVDLPQRRELLGGGGIIAQRRAMAGTDGGRGFRRSFNDSLPAPSYQQDPYREYQTAQVSDQGYPLAGPILEGGLPGLITGSVKRVFQHHVLYLAIVNMPTDEELNAATAILSGDRTAKHE